jgi:molybdopterin-guanine dinucleotide biosynthesis protein A
MLDIDGFILAGGASRRMGTDKARLRLGEWTFVERIRQALSAIAARISLVGGRPAANVWEGPVVPDIYTDWGALGGLHAALAHAQQPWVAIVACDLPFVTAELFTYLAACRDQFAAVVPAQADGRWQPLCALYARQPCLVEVEKLIASGERRPRALLQRVPTRRVEAHELAHLANASSLLLNINTPEDYALARKLSTRSGHSEPPRKKIERAG